MVMLELESVNHAHGHASNVQVPIAVKYVTILKGGPYITMIV